MIPAVISALHLLALAIGLPAIWLRARALGGPLDEAGLRRVFAADNAWGLAAFLWLATGPWRAFGPLEKGPGFYMSTSLFHLKLGLFGVIFLLELWPMLTLIGWRRQKQRGEAVDTKAAGGLRAVSWIEAAIVVVIVFVASFMARGFGMRG